MAKQDYILRHMSIVRKLRKSGQANFREIREYLRSESELLDRPLDISIRTFQRDLEEIRTIYFINIQYDFSTKAYYIAEDLHSDIYNRMLESVDTLNALRLAGEAGKYMFFERRRAGGTHHFQGLLNAIRNRIVINLVHRKFDCDEPTERLVDPLALKESKGRWYLFARDRADHRLKTFGLDRILGFESTPRRFDYPATTDVNEHFRHCFGVINPEDASPEEVILSFRPEQGKYITSYPLHDSQTVLADNERELRIRMNIYITHDLVMEILSYGDTVEALTPMSLRKILESTFKTALALYK